MNRTYKGQRPKVQKLWTTIGNSLLLKQMWKNPPTDAGTTLRPYEAKVYRIVK